MDYGGVIGLFVVGGGGVGIGGVRGGGRGGRRLF